MNKKIITISLFIFLTILLEAEVFLPKYYLGDYISADDNKVEFYKGYLKNISLIKKNFYFAKNISITKSISADYETKYIEIDYKLNNKFEMAHPFYLTPQEYLKNQQHAIFRAILKDKIKELLNQKENQSAQGLIKDIVLKIPKYTMPKAVTKFLGGDEVAHLRLNGNQSISFSGKSTKTKNKSYNEGLGNKNFSLKMQQDLNLTLNGTIGKKIFVNVTHKTPQKDQINVSGNDKVDVHYEGLEDEIVKEVKAGDVKADFKSGLGSGISTNGLFGVKSKMKIGNLDLNLVMGKDKTKKTVQSFHPNSQTQQKTIQSRDFAKNVFYIDDPRNLYEIYSQSDVPSQFPDWAGNAFKLNDKGQWIVKNPGLLPAENTTIHIFLDDDNATNDQLTVRGKNWSDPADTTTYHFTELSSDSDYSYDIKSGLITFSYDIQKQYTIGIIFDRADGMQIGDPTYNEDDPNSYIQVKLLKKKNQDNTTDTWVYQCRNIYDLGMQDISPDGFELKAYNLNANNTQNYYYNSGVNYTDFLHLDTNGDKIVNGDDNSVNLKFGKIIIPMIYPFYALGDSIIYEKSNLTSNDETRMYMSVKGKIKIEQISLGSMSIVKNSVVVKLNGTALKPNIDYTVDYDLGIITLLNEQAMTSFDKISVEYEEIPLFSLESKTLLASEGIYKYGGDLLTLDGMVAYQSESVKEERPKIGGENRSIILGGLSAKYKLNLPFLTKLVGKIPFINSDAESKLSLSSNFNMSIPYITGSSKQPNKDEAYVEDMESSLETMGLGVTRRLWVPASKPYQLDFHRATPNWFVLPTWRAGDVYDNLSDKEKKEKIPVLTVKVIPDTTYAGGEYWSGLMKYIGNEVDLSDKDFIELMIKPEDVGSNVTVNIDMGKISEDFYTDFGGEGVLNTEDGKNGGALNGTLDVGEDTGLDGIKNSEEEGYSADNKDPHHDNFDSKKVNNEFPYINRTENNSTLDTEDLNSNGRLDTQNVYFEYSFSLDDFAQWFVGDTHSGFKFYRIPIKDFSSIVSSTGSQPSLDKIDFIRLWFGVDQESKFDIAFFNLIGNKWKKRVLVNEDGSPIDPHYIDPDEDFRVGTTDTQKNPHYVQPKQTIIKSQNSTLEQSVFVDYSNLKRDHLAVIYEKISSFNENSTSYNPKGLNLTGYKKIRYLAYAENAENGEYHDDDYLHYYFRIGTDSLNYYEIRYDSLKVNPYDAYTEDGIAKMKRSNWQQFEINFSDLTKAKSNAMETEQDSTLVVGKYRIRIVHQKNQWPTLTNVKMLMFGISPAERDFNGKVYYDDIRVADAYQAPGYQFNTNLSFNLAGISDLSLTYNTVTPNFLNSASRDSKAGFLNSRNLTLSNNWYFGKFLPAEWGVSLPFTWSETKQYSLPLYKANSDLPLSSLSKDEKEREIQRNSSMSASINYSMNKTPRSKILEYTMKKTQLYFNYNKVNNYSSTSRDTSKTYSTKLIYNLDIPQDAIDIKLWKNYRFYFFPKKFTNTYTYSNDDKTKWIYSTLEDSLGWQKDKNTYPEKKFQTENGITYDMFSDLSFSYNIKTTRDLNLEKYFKKIPIGVEKDRNQTISSTYSPHYLDKIFTFSINPSATYTDNHKKTGVADTLYFSGNVSRNTSVNLTLKNSDLLSSLAGWLDKKFSQKQKSSKENKKGESKKEGEKKSEKKEENGSNLKDNKVNEKQNYKGTVENNPKKNLNDNIEKNEFDKNKGNFGKNGYKKNSNNYGKKNQVQSHNIFVKMINYLSRVSNISATYQNKYSSSYEQFYNRPSFAYQLGLPNILKKDELTREEKDNNFDFSTNFDIISGLSTSWHFQKQLTKSRSQTNNYSNSTTFPDVSIRFTNFGSLFHIEKIIQSTNLTSAYSLNKKETGILGNSTPDRLENNFRLDPLLSWDANWIYGVKTQLSSSYSLKKSITNNSANQIISYDIQKGLNLKINWSFSAPSGIDVPLLKRIHFKNELTPSLNLNWTEEKTYNEKDKKHPEKWDWSIDITPKADYKFNKSITGSFSMEYKLSKNLKDNSSVRDFSMGISANVEF